MAVSTEKLLTLSQFKTGLQASKNYTDAEITKVNTAVSKKADQTSLDETNGKVATLETQMATAQTDISENETAISNEVTRAKAAEAANATAASTAQAAAEAADAKAVKAQEEVDALELEVATINGKVGTNTTDISTMKGQISALEAGTYDDSEVRGLISQNAQAIEANAGEIATIKGDYLKASDKSELAEDIQGNADAIAAVKEDVDAFFKDADLTESAKDTLKELQEYIASDETAASEMLASINQNKSDIDAIEADYLKAADKTELQGAINGKADKATTLAGYGITDAYTKTETDAKIVELINSNVVINVATDAEVTAACTEVFGA